MADAPYKSTTYKGYVISWNGANYQAVDPKTGTVIYTGYSPDYVKLQIREAK